MNESDLSAFYLSQFRDHIAQVQAHLLGQTQTVLLPSIGIPTVYWTSFEKNLFFRALARHSRLRPDLIAAHIETKSVVDVCAYIHLLHAASKDNPISRARKDIEIAFEVSDSWVEYEEQAATSLATAELMWDIEQRRISRQAQVAKKRDDFETAEMFDNWRAEAEAQWSREESLQCLDTLQLDVLESILRTGDPALTSNNADDTQDSDAPTDPLPPPIGSPLPNVSTINAERITSKSRGDPPNSPLPQVAPEVLSPTSRRRLQKRLYMRRKRAEQSGAEMNHTVNKLRPGREKIKRQSKLQPKKQKGHKISGLTRPYRIRQQFAEQQINLTELQRTGLDLFHLSTLSRLIELYKSGYTEVEEDVITSVSADTISLLRAVVVAFVTEVIHRAIVFRNQEFQRKGDVKAWRLGEKEISADNIQSCLEMMEFENLTKKVYFERLLRDQTGSDELSMDENEAEGSPEADHGNVSESEDQPDHNINIMVDRLLPVFTLSPQHVISLFSAEYGDDTSLMPVDTDGDSLRKELEEEEQLDPVDEVAMQQYESELWKQEI
ncbi:hypothetical protein F5887DRAFT_884263 [Amanita rubescens]|nr:hypothetical protein F5887DRAFT_884263 [Amanita rubescens]